MARDRIKIVRLLSRLNIGGPARHVVWLCAGENRDRFESRLVCGQLSPYEGDMEYFAREHGVEVQYLKNFKRSIGAADLFAFFEVLRLLYREKPDIIDTHASKAGFLGRLAGLCYRFFSGQPVKLVHTFHGNTLSGYFGPLKSWLFLWIERLLARFATDRIIVLSDQQKRELLDQYRVGPPGLFTVLPLGIDLERRPGRRGEFRQAFGISPRTLLVAHIGRLTAIKNQAMFLDTISILRARQPRLDIHFCLIGDGELRPDLEKRVAALGLSSLVTFTGFLRDMDRVYRDCDLLAMTSLNEGTPLVVLEAMLYGLPVVSTAVGGLPDLLGRRWRKKEGEWTLSRSVHPRGQLVTGFEPLEFALALEKLALDETLRRELGRRAFDFIRRYHGRDRLVRDMEEIYQSLARPGE